MYILFTLILILSQVCHAEIGKILRIEEGSGSYLLRGSARINLTSKTLLESGDIILTENSSLLIQIYPFIQAILSQNTKLRVVDFNFKFGDDKVNSWGILQFYKGMLRTKVENLKGFESELKIDATDVSFTSQGGEFEISSQEGELVDVDVFKGMVSASSVHVQSFVPEIINSSQSLRFHIRKKSFEKRKFSPDPNNFSGFQKTEAILKNWKERAIKEKRSDVKLRIPSLNGNKKI